ncbi:MAG: endonuclease/exonuclease/phosphatase family protein [Bacteroidetes bacterium]|nr:endonuclease/exonuclease/phosphatase family protein [Fibrella sp.]
MTIEFTPGKWISWFFASLFWSLNILLVLYTCLLYYLLHWLPVQHWTAGLLLITLPLAWAVNLAFILFWIVGQSWRAVLSLVILLTGFWLWPRTFAYEPVGRNVDGQPTVSIFSYNVMTFDAVNYFPQKKLSATAQAVTRYVCRQTADILCFQEFYNEPTLPAFNIIERLGRVGYPYYVTLHPSSTKGETGLLGVALFSRYPILRQGEVIFKEFNGMVWADVKVGRDTVRIINTHLQSMGIRVTRVFTEDEIEGVKYETRSILNALRTGFTDRRVQVQSIEDYINQSPYPVIVTGDFNDTPYSIVYERLRRRLRNAFEDAGRGFGFTLNRAPSFVRIDNQFYDPRLTAFSFETLRDVPFSDHFPILGRFGIKQPTQEAAE